MTVFQELQTCMDAAMDLQTYVMLYGVRPGEDLLVDIVVDVRGLIGWASFRHHFIPAWCDWEWVG
jgi:hypothetical protein